MFDTTKRIPTRLTLLLLPLRISMTGLIGRTWFVQLILRELTSYILNKILEI